LKQKNWSTFLLKANGHFYGGGSVIVDFEHNSVLRSGMTSVTGELISPVNGSKSYSTQVPSAVQDVNKLRVVAFVIDVIGEVQNVRAAKVGETQSLETIQ